MVGLNEVQVRGDERGDPMRIDDLCKPEDAMQRNLDSETQWGHHSPFQSLPHLSVARGVNEEAEAGSRGAFFSCFLKLLNQKPTVCAAMPSVASEYVAESCCHVTSGHSLKLSDLVNTLLF